MHSIPGEAVPKWIQAVLCYFSRNSSPASFKEKIMKLVAQIKWGNRWPPLLKIPQSLENLEGSPLGPLPSLMCYLSLWSPASSPNTEMRQSWRWERRGQVHSTLLLFSWVIYTHTQHITWTELKYPRKRTRPELEWKPKINPTHPTLLVFHWPWNTGLPTPSLPSCWRTILHGTLYFWLLSKRNEIIQTTISKMYSKPPQKTKGVFPEGRGRFVSWPE